MTWVLSSITVGDDQTIAAAVDEQFEGFEKSQREQYDDCRDQIDAAVAAAESLRTAVSRPGDSVTVNLSGHYNKDHEPQPGWADDMIIVRISQLPAPVED